MMASDSERWDPSLPGFLVAVLRVLLVLLALVCGTSAVRFPTALPGVVAGGILALALYLAALQVGRVFLRTLSFTRAMVWLLLQQFILWVGMALLLLVARVDPIGFVFGVSILPVAPVLTLVWYAIQRRRLRS